MSQAIGIELNVLGLSSFVKDSLDYLDQVQLARQFGNDFPACLFALDLVRLRLTRWADSVGAFNPQNPFSQILGEESDMKLLKTLLESIAMLFEDAKRTSERFEVDVEPEQRRVFDEDSATLDLTGHFKYLHGWARAKTECYQKHTSLVKKTSWALYQKKHLDKLIEDLASNVDSLIELFPMIKQKQQERCAVEISEIPDRDSLLALHHAAVTTDYVLRDAVKNAIARGGHTWGNLKVNGFGTSHQGDQIAPGQRPIGNRHIFGDIDISDDAISSQGDRVGMGDIIADAIAKRHELRMKLIDSK
jgi:hypothetical protein